MREAAQKRLTIWCDCPCCGYKKALAVSERDGKRLFHCFAGCSQTDLLMALRGHKLTIRHQEFTLKKEAACVKAYTEKLWRESLSANGTRAQVYLRERGIVLSPLPSSIRFLSNYVHRPSRTNWPVMLAAVMDISGRLKAVHRTYLTADGKSKAPVAPAKMTLGPVGGFACHLAEAGEELAVSEGIETGLSFQQATGIATWAALSAGGIHNLILPLMPLASRITIAADADPVGLRYARDAALLWREQGRRVRIAVPPDNQDFNDVLMSAVAP